MSIPVSTPGGGGWPFPAGHLPSPDLFGMDEAAARIRTALRGALNVPRRKRLERRRWQEAADTFDRLGGPAGLAVVSTNVGDFSGRPYLVVHPEREIAHEAGMRWYTAWWQCEACKVTGQDITSSHTPAEREAWAIIQVHEHNAAMHPRRHARSQQPRVDTRIVASDPHLDAESAAQAAASNPWSVKP